MATVFREARADGLFTRQLLARVCRPPTREPLRSLGPVWQAVKDQLSTCHATR